MGEQAIFFARLNGLSRSEAVARQKEWFERMEISDWWNKKVEELSKGMAQKVQFIITVLHRPKLLIFDEPFSGFDPINAQLLKNEILRLKDEGATVIFSTHNMGSVEEICDRITLINRAHNILTGDVAELRSQYSKGRFTLSYQGDTDTLRQALSPACKTITPLEADSQGNSRLEILLRDEATRRDVIAMANETTDLVGFAPKLLSMSDIFIRAVEENNEPQPPEFTEN